MAKFFPRTMLKVLSAFEPDKQYSIRQLMEMLPECKYIDWNVRHYHANHLLSRKKERTITWNIDNIEDIKTSKYYLYHITNKGLKKVKYLKMNKG